MSTEIALRGVEKLPALQQVLTRAVVAADLAIGFVSRKLDGLEPGQQAILSNDLWNGSEPYFIELMAVFHCAIEDLNALAIGNPEAKGLVERIPSTEGSSDIKYVRHVLEIASRVANEWLAAHPVEEYGLIIRAFEYLLNKTSSRFWLWYAIFLMPLFECIRHPWQALRANKREKER